MALTSVKLSCPYAPYHKDVYGREIYFHLFVKLGGSWTRCAVSYSRHPLQHWR